MLFHVTIRHDAAHCPGFHEELMGPAMEAMGNLDATAAQFGVKIIGLYNALPDHVEFLIAEAENAAAIAMFLSTANPYGEIAETETKSVVTHTQLLEMGKQMMAGAAEPAS